MHSSYEMGLIPTNADVERARETARSSNLGDEAMNTSLLDNITKIANVKADSIIEAARLEMINLIAQRAGLICLKRSQAKNQTQINQSVVDILQIGNSSAENGSKTVLVRFLERTMAEI